MKKETNKRILPGSIVIAAIIIGVIILITQLSRQHFIKNQQTLLDDCLYNASIVYENSQTNSLWNTIPSWSPAGQALAANLKNAQETCIQEYK